MAILGLGFVACALVIAGLPPLSGFLAKFAILAAALGASGPGPGAPVPIASWILLGILILSGFATLIAMTRAGIRVFWTPLDPVVPRVRLIEVAPVGALLLLCVVQTVQAAPMMRYVAAAAASVHAPQDYIRHVLPAGMRSARGGFAP
jgi:multicomponent K+:H+ antiporter subunit D